MKSELGVPLIVALVIGLVLPIAVRPYLSAHGAGDPAVAQELTLITSTPDQGFALAVSLSRRGVTATQPDREVLHALRAEYAQDAGSLIAASHVVAVHFQTIAAANDYWR